MPPPGPQADVSVDGAISDGLGSSPGTKDLLWSHSGPQGRGTCPELSLEAVRSLAIRSGFVFETQSTATTRDQADLQGLFSHVGVNSLSAFKKLFSSRTLPDPKLPADNSTPARLTGLQPQAGIQELENCNGTYHGEVQNGVPHGLGRQVFQAGNGSMVSYEGQFHLGARHGVGVMTVERTRETYMGLLHNGKPYGTGVFVFGTPQAVPTAPFRVKFEGEMVAKPMGAGIMTWSDGQQVVGRFNGFRMTSDPEEGTQSGALRDECLSAAATAKLSAEKATLQQAAVKSLLRIPPQS